MANAVKLLVNAEAGLGKTELLRSLGEETFVISRDAKNFPLPLPHFLVDNWVNMDTLIYGDVDSEGNQVEGIVQKLKKYHTKFGKYPTNVAIDSVSQIFMDVIETASQTKNVYGSQGQEITKEMAKLTKFIHESLEMSGINVIMLNHVLPEKVEGVKTGTYVSFGSGKFLEKRGFYSTVNESITMEMQKDTRKVYLRGPEKLARTTLPDLPEVMWVENFVDPKKSRKLSKGETYYTLKSHMDSLVAAQSKVQDYSI